MKRPARQRGVAWVTLLAMIVCQLPAPIPVPAAAVGENGKDRSELYPCRDRPCGCASASACWTGCCCFTNAQKVAWAKANGVSIPAFVHDAAKREAAAESAAPAGKSCCGTTKPQNESKPAPKASCCGTKRGGCDSDADVDDDAPPAPLGWMAQKCRGEIAACGALPWALRPILFDGELPAPIEWERPRSVCVATLDAEPPTPPPRLLLAASAL
ncbi:hypothetical protein LzC2_12000 [Planctomycetes bacterium LzC2]|uniref:Secreted protein n=2 Tax=Alienimonas chondri TaxID=2681879 RepID=A0ABX1VAL6_9PLAN|nr:hypothetical protein [Alienimonas chondri]